MSLKQFSQNQKLTILNSAKQIGMKKAAEIADVHYTTVYDWRRQLQSIGKQAFLDYKPTYPGRGQKKITAQQESAVLDCWKNNTGWGPGQVRNQLRRSGITVSIRTIRKIMQANGYKVHSKKSSESKGTRFEAPRPLDLAQMDILEFFINKLKVYLILLLDDFSRFLLGWRLLEQTSVDEVIHLVAESIDRYGKMQEILTDRGFVFYSWRGINRFEKYLENERIDHTHARPHHPQTLGKVEACNRRIKKELIDQRHFTNLHDADEAVGHWVEYYNYKRPHQGIGGFLAPAERFHGQSGQVLSAIDKGIDITSENCYAFDMERSIINLSATPEGKITLYLLGQPFVLNGGEHAD